MGKRRGRCQAPSMVPCSARATGMVFPLAVMASTVGHPVSWHAGPWLAKRRYPPTSPVTAPPVRVSVIVSWEIVQAGTRALAIARDAGRGAGDISDQADPFQRS